MKKQFWDHSSKPSVFVEVTDGVETYRGPFRGATRPKEIEELRRERDEAREALAEALQSLECAVKDIFEMRQLIKEIRRDLPRV